MLPVSRLHASLLTSMPGRPCPASAHFHAPATTPLACPPPACRAVPGATWSHNTTGLVFRFVNITNGGANMQICRKAVPAKETLASCKAGLDNDCNFKARREGKGLAALAADGPA